MKEEQGFWMGVYYGRYDKSVHFISSCLLTFFGLLIFRSVLVFFVIFSLGVIKEFRDMLRPHDRFDWYDIGTNMLGIVAGYYLWRAALMTL